MRACGCVRARVCECVPIESNADPFALCAHPESVNALAMIMMTSTVPQTVLDQYTGPKTKSRRSEMQDWEITL
ncbi:hypothetical protein EVAR_70937_1 [Eumeta japonica]|uniref:Uncharacterized protein n=1 Tax=Eumeta variegata TaxID=151549 RepID=A0A4C2AAK5_EUMVA|nr:hypothetical protein EVAR_70937_1 [Eumeta japonica]